MTNIKNDYFSITFKQHRISLLFDACSLIRAHDLEETIKLLATYFDLYTTDFNKSELEYKTNNSKEQSELLFNKMIEITKYTSTANGSIKVLKSSNKFKRRDFRKYKEKVMQLTPRNNLSNIDIILLYIASHAMDRVILVTDDAQLYFNAKLNGICSMSINTLIEIIAKHIPKDLEDIRKALYS